MDRASRCEEALTAGDATSAEQFADEWELSNLPQQVPGAVGTSGQADMIESENASQVKRSVEVPVTSTRDSVEHLVRAEAMTRGSAGCYVAVCGHPVRAAALACPPGPRCPACVAVHDTDTANERRRHRQRPSGRWGWLNLVRRGRHRAAGTSGGGVGVG